MRRRVVSCIMVFGLCVNLLPSSIFADSLNIDSGVAPNTYEEVFVQDEEIGMEYTDAPESGLPDEETGKNDNEMNSMSKNEAEGEWKEEEKDSDTSVITDVSTEDENNGTIRNSKNAIEKNDAKVIQEDASPDRDTALTKEACNDVIVSEYDDEAVTSTLAANGMYWPLDTNHGITNAFTQAHGGADLACASGTPIYAVTSGTASYYQAYRTYDGTKYLTSYGNFVRIENGSTTTLYAHMNSFEGFSLQIPSSRTKKVSGSENKIFIGSRYVNEGDVIGYVGTTGNSTGPHLHFEVRINGTQMNPADYVSRSMSARDHGKGSNSCNCSDSYAGTYVCTSKTTLNIRSTHDASSSIVGSIPSGAEVHVSKADGSWAHVSYNGINGYASMTYLQKSQSYPEPGYVGAAGGTRYTPSSIWWDKGSNVKSYDVRIYKNGNLVNTFWSLKETELQTWLPEGNYHVTVAYVNDSGWKNGLNEADFTVGAGSHLNLGDHFYGCLIINKNWHTITAKNDGDVKVGSEADDVNSYWEFIRQSDGSYCIRNCENGKVLDVYGGNSASGTNVIVSGDHGGTNQRWYIYGRWSGEYILKPKNSDCVLDVSGGENKVGDNIQIWDLNYTDAQKFAIWTLSSYTVSFNANGGSGAPGNNIKVEGKALNLPGTVPKREGYTFVNWNTSADGKGSAYQAGAQYTANANVTLYAQWKENKFALDVNGHLDSDSTATNINGYGTFDVYINGKLDKNDVSDYWAELPAGTSYEIADIKARNGKSYGGISSGSRTGTISGATNVRLRYITIPDSPGVSPIIDSFGGHTYYYYDRNSTWYEAKYFSEKAGGHLVSITSAEENGFVSSLVGDRNVWIGLTDEASEGTWRWVSGEALSYKNWSSGEPNNYAQLAEEGEDYVILLGNGSWNDAVGPEQLGFVCEIDKTYTIRYDANGGSNAPGSQNKAHGKAVALSSVVPTRDGYTFTGWNTSQNGGGTAYNPGASYTADTNITLYAQWKTAGKEMAYGYPRTVPDGEYQIVAYKNPNYMLDIDGNAVPAADGANVQLYSRGNRSQDTFLLTYDPDDGCYSIVQKGTQMSLDVVDSSVTEGANVQMYHWHDVPAQKWAISWVGDVGNGIGYRIQSKCNGFSLDIVNGGSDSVYVNGTNIRMWTGNNSQAQSWMLIPVYAGNEIKDGRYILRSGVKPELELDVAGDSGNVPAGTNVQVWNDGSKDFSDRALSQYNSFDVSYIGDGYYKLVHASSGLALEVTGASKERLANVCLGEADVGNYGQQWTTTALNGGYVLRARCSGQALDVADGNTADGTNVRQHPCALGNAQLWYFVPAEYGVSYDANGGSGAPQLQTKYYKGQLALDVAVPKRTGYKFTGWNTKPDGKGTPYAAGALYKEDANVTLYAQWKLLTYAVAYNANGGTSAPSKQVKGYGKALALSDVVPTREGYDFIGWNTTADGSGTPYQPKALYKKNAKVTLYAQWKAALNPAVDPAIEVGSVRASVGSTVSVPIMIKNNPGIVSMELSVQYDTDRLTWTGVERGKFGGMIDGDVGTTLTWLGEDPRTNVTLNSTMIILKFTVKDDAKLGDAEVTVSYNEDDIYNVSEENVAFAVVPGKVTVSSYTPGDINGDGKVNNKDVMRLMRHLKYKDVDYVADALDVNGDGKVNNKDVMRLMRFLKYKDVTIF